MNRKSLVCTLSETLMYRYTQTQKTIAKRSKDRKNMHEKGKSKFHKVNEQRQ